MKTIILSDMDGTFLTEDYSYEDAMPAYKLAKEKNIPVCFCTSKGFEEIKYFEDKLDQKNPIIVENGSAIYIPNDYFSFPIEGNDYKGYIEVELNVPHSETLKVLKEIKNRVEFPLHIFSEQTVEELKERFGLPKEMAERALQKKFGDGFWIPDRTEDKVRKIEEIASEFGFETKIGGRAVGINKGCDKGKATKILIDLYKKEYGEVQSIGLGDSENDFPMLISVDYPFLVQRPDGSYTSEKFQKIEGIGPKGWNNAVNKIVKK